MCARESQARIGRCFGGKQGLVSDLGQIFSTRRNLERQMSKIPGDVPKETRAPASQVIKAYIPPWTLIIVSLF